ncbi:MAG: helix-turn-helix transcriptional regulator [Oscillospiraceae bacterium]|nr:helix-turn-helix transcriptional regulator [Oscillospiraceae bacterium]
MFCNGENPILRITDVTRGCWNACAFTAVPRTYSSLIFRIKGSAAITCCGKEYRINTNDILYIPQNLTFQAEYTDTELIAIHFVTANDDKKPEVYSFENTEELYKLFMRAAALWENKEPGYPVYLMAQLYTILGTILAQNTASALPRPFIKAISFINANYKNSAINVNMICAEAGISATAFRGLFRKHYQKTPTQYFNELRLAYARNLISGGMTVENAACESGFNDPKYFARVVKKHYGCTPRDLKFYGK